MSNQWGAPRAKRAARPIFWKNQILFDEKFLYLLKFIENKYEKSIKEYLGDNYILVNFTVMKTSKLTKSVSECWHTDNLGHKINLLICVDGDGSIPTFYKPGTNKKKYFPTLFKPHRIYQQLGSCGC